RLERKDIATQRLGEDGVAALERRVGLAQRGARRAPVSVGHVARPAIFIAAQALPLPDAPAHAQRRFANRAGATAETAAASDTTGCRRGRAASASRARRARAPTWAAQARPPDGRCSYRR